MLKKLVVIAVVSLAVFVGGPAFAGQADSNTGCGLGTMLWDGGADDSILFQVFQATTNGTSGNQTFGITSGTLGCESPASFVVNERLNEFSGANMDTLARDISMGQGESLNTLAELMDIQVGDRAEFSANLQSNFDQIFITGNENSGTVLDRIFALN